MKARVAQACLCGLLIFLAMWRSATADGPDPTSAYEKRSVQEFTILVNRRVLEHKKDARRGTQGGERAAREDRPRRLAQAASVAHVHGGKRKAYAATNYKEYFAELTEAYFGKNDFFPFNRVDLKKYDPTGYQLMQDVWGQPSEGAAPSRKR